MATDTKTAGKAELESNPVVDVQDAPLPTKKTLRMRKSIPTQLFKFVAFDLLIMRMVLKGHASD